MANFFAEPKRRRTSGATTAHAVVACVLLQFVNSAAAPVLAAESPRRVYLLQGLTSSERPLQRAAEAFTQRLNERSSEEIEVYTEFLDLQRFGGPENENRLIETLSAKFAQVKPDLVVPIAQQALDFVVRHRSDFARDIPIVYCCTTESTSVPPDIPGVLIQFDWAGTLELAERLQPNAKTLVIISRASDLGSGREEAGLRQLQPFLEKYDTKYLTGLHRDALLKEVSHLPRDSIVLMRRFFEQGGDRSRGAELAEKLSKASNAPIYSMSANYFGSGILGGVMDSFADQGTKTADLALDILSGKSPATLAHQTRLPLRYRVDSRQLERWGFAKESLPPATSVEFHQPTLWEEYRGTIMFALLALAVQGGIIALLLIAMRKRREAESEAERRRKELTHAMRVAALGELSGGIAHELGQPLAAILANAQAAQAIVADEHCDREEVAKILEDIVQEDRRAGDVIHGIRRLLKKGECEPSLINVNDKIASTLGLLHSELVNRGIKVQTDLKADLPTISGDRVELQQVFLNLMMNAMDAMTSTPHSERTLSIRTRSTEEGRIEVSITDRGRGIPPDQLKRAFEPFFTTKERGLGLGLSICLTIINSHRGRLKLSNAEGGGVTAVVSLPAAVQLAAAS